MTLSFLLFFCYILVGLLSRFLLTIISVDEGKVAATMWMHKLRKKKFQFLLIGIILFFASAIFIACLSFTVETGNYAADYFSKRNCPDVFVSVASGAPAEALLKEAQQSPDFTHLVTLASYLPDGKLKIGNRDITPNYYHIYALSDYHTLSWQVTPISGKTNENGPASGEIWVTNVYADQKNIHVGDKIMISGSGRPLTVSALIDDAFCPSSMFGVYPFYVNEPTLSSFTGGISSRLLVISSKTDYTQVETWLRGRSALITESLMDTFNVSQLMMSFTMFTLVLGSIGMLSAAMIFVVTLVIIRFLIKNNLLKEYHSIGVYKALGFSDLQIVGFYLKCYMAVGAVGLLLGAAAGLPLGFLIESATTKYIGHFHMTYVSALLAVGGAALLWGLMLLFVWHAHRHIRQITPVQALQIGVNSSPKKLTRSLLPNASSAFATAVNDLFKHRSISAMFILILTVSFYLSAFFLSINYTCSHIVENADVWFGLPKADCYISGSLTAADIAAVQRDPAVSKAIYGFPIEDISIKTEKDSEGANFNDSSVISWNDFAGKDFFSSFKKGRPPRYANEIAVSSGTAKGSALAAGDYVTLSLGSGVKSYLVTGIYDNMMHASKSLEMTPAGLAAAGIAFEPDTMAVHLKPGADYAAFASRVKKQTGLDAGRSLNILSDSIMGIEVIMNPVTVILVAVFIVFSLLNIVNLLLTTQIDNRRKFGILKSLGFTTGYISLQSLFRTLLLSLVGAALAVALQLLLSPALFYAFLHINALIDSPVAFVTLMGFIFACILALTLLFCIPLRRVSPVELMEE
jgi:ABC-type transport system, involved in lipoprotein release, permease component